MRNARHYLHYNYACFTFLFITMKTFFSLKALSVLIFFALLFSVLPSLAQSERGTNVSDKSLAVSRNIGKDIGKQVNSWVQEVASELQTWGNSVRGSGKIVSENRELGEFTKVRLANSGDAFIKYGTKREVRVEADDNILENVLTEVNEKGELVIGMKRGSWNMSKLNVYITIPKLDGVAVSGSGSIEVESGFQSEEIKSGISGSGSIRYKGGVATRHNVRISGSGSVTADKLEADDVNVEISGSGNSDIFVKKSLTASISGSGDVHYKGTPTNISKTIRGSGSISQR
jgi:hypothetical protein